MGETIRSQSGGAREDGAAFDHTPAPGEGKPDASAADEGAGGDEKILGKFETQEDLVKAYQELQAKLGGKTAEEETVTPDPDPIPENTDGLIKKVADAGIDVDALNKEFADTGELSQETMDSLVKRGIPQPMVEAYIAGQKSLVTNAISSLAEITGGKDQLAQTLSWAGENLSDAEIDAYNSAMEGGNVAMTQTILRGIVAAYRADVGEESRNIDGEQGRPAGIKPFANDAEMILAESLPTHQLSNDGFAAGVGPINISRSGEDKFHAPLFNEGP